MLVGLPGDDPCDRCLNNYVWATIKTICYDDFGGLNVSRQVYFLPMRENLRRMKSECIMKTVIDCVLPTT